MEPRKQAILEALRAWVAQRPGFDLGNYDRAGYRSDSRRVTQQRHDFERMANSVETLAEITADDLIKAASSAFSGRLSFRVDTNPREMEAGDIWDSSHSIGIDYCTGQYWCTEYRAAACAVLASALWASHREDLPSEAPRYRTRTMTDPSCMPPRDRVEHQYEKGGKWLSAGDWMRASFRNWFGAGIQSRWFS